MSEYLDIGTWCVTIKEALEKYSPLREYAHKGKIDLGDADALRVYNQAIAKVLLDLEIEVPQTHLIPTICLRYAYVKILKEKYQIKSMLEIGTGASAIISLVAAKSYGIDVIATEINSDSLASAESNISRNKMDGKIHLIKSAGGILKGVVPRDDKFDILTCYPPVYPDLDTVHYTKEGRKLRGYQGAVSEMIGGGKDGFDFSRQLIDEAISDYSNVLDRISLLFIKKEHADMAIQIFEDNHCDSIETISIKAGNRFRYLVVARL